MIRVASSGSEAKRVPCSSSLAWDTVERMLSRIPAVFFEGEAEKEKEEAG